MRTIYPPPRPRPWNALTTPLSSRGSRASPDGGGRYRIGHLWESKVRSLQNFLPWIVTTPGEEASLERGEKEQYTPSGDPLRVVMTAQRPSRDKIGVRGHEKDASRREHRDAGGGRRYDPDCTRAKDSPATVQRTVTRYTMDCRSRPRGTPAGGGQRVTAPGALRPHRRGRLTGARGTPTGDP